MSGRAGGGRVVIRPSVSLAFIIVYYGVLMTYI